VISPRARLVLLSAVLTVAIIEMVSFAGLAALRRIRPRLLWAPDVARFESGYRRFLELHHPLLGWPTVDSTTPRPSPAFPAGVRSCVALFGDSFTRASEVSDKEAWGNLLAERLHCRVANYGAGGYGTDQAFLRYRDRAEPAPIVILGIFEDNLQRNVNRFRELLVGARSYTFKPRFKLEGHGGVELVPMALPGPRDARAFIQSPERFLSDEYFLPGSSAGPVRPRFPFTLSLIRLLLHPDVRAVLAGRPYWERFYRPGHDSGALEITLAIVRLFQAEANASKQHPLVLLFPSPKTLQRIKPTGERPYQSLIDGMRETRIPSVDLSVGLLKRLSGGNPCELATEPQGCRGHYNARGNAWIAEIVQEALIREGWLRDSVSVLSPCDSRNRSVCAENRTAAPPGSSPDRGAAGSSPSESGTPAARERLGNERGNTSRGTHR
jgi:hypothetical protein